VVRRYSFSSVGQRRLLLLSPNPWNWTGFLAGCPTYARQAARISMIASGKSIACRSVQVGLGDGKWREWDSFYRRCDQDLPSGIEMTSTRYPHQRFLPLEISIAGPNFPRLPGPNLLWTGLAVKARGPQFRSDARWRRMDFQRRCC
jgi:hypothetical protein